MRNRKEKAPISLAAEIGATGQTTYQGDLTMTNTNTKSKKIKKIASEVAPLSTIRCVDPVAKLVPPSQKLSSQEAALLRAFKRMDIYDRDLGVAWCQEMASRNRTLRAAPVFRVVGGST